MTWPPSHENKACCHVQGNSAPRSTAAKTRQLTDRSNKRPYDKHRGEPRMRCRGRGQHGFVSHHEVILQSRSQRAKRSATDRTQFDKTGCKTVATSSSKGARQCILVKHWFRKIWLTDIYPEDIIGALSLSRSGRYDWQRQFWDLKVIFGVFSFHFFILFSPSSFWRRGVMWNGFLVLNIRHSATF